MTFLFCSVSISFSRKSDFFPHVLFNAITVLGISWRVIQSLINIESKNVKPSRDKSTTLIENSRGKLAWSGFFCFWISDRNWESTFSPKTKFGFAQCFSWYETRFDALNVTTRKLLKQSFSRDFLNKIH